MAVNIKLKAALKAQKEARAAAASTEKVLARVQKQLTKDNAAVVAAEEKVAKLSATE